MYQSRWLKTSKALCGCKLKLEAYNQSIPTSSLTVPECFQHSSILFGRPKLRPLRSMVTALSHTTVMTIVPTFCVDKTGKNPWATSHGQPLEASATPSTTAWTPRTNAPFKGCWAFCNASNGRWLILPKATAPLRGADLMAQRVLRLLRRMPRMVWRRNIPVAAVAGQAIRSPPHRVQTGFMR